MNADQGSSVDTVGAPDGGTETSGTGETDAPLASRRSGRATALKVIGRWTRRYLVNWRSLLATALVVATVGGAAGVFFVQYRPDQRMSDAAARQAIQAASDGAVALLSYSFDSLDRDFAAAKSHLTGNFLAYYSKFSEQIAAGALQGQLTTTAKVIRAAVSDLHPDAAVVLVFVNQTTTSKRKPEPLEAHSGILVTLTKVNGSWLIANFDPVG
ncbi:MAG: Mce-associated rane protein [Mycobacterium sp.]|jgi:Mce-associated membrane protein|nr:Mce-associated rane protein [Mycobacterium sp.]